jgi:hypothetical protein
MTCQCSHGIGFHDIAKNGQRTACSVYEGPRATPCSCKSFQPTTTQENA